MNMRKLISALLCALMCIAMLPAQASTAMDTYYLSDIDMAISVPAEWYVGTADEGVDSELAVNFGLDQSGVDALFINGGMSLLAATDLSANRQLQVATVSGMPEGDMRSMTAEEEQAFLEDMRYSAVNGGAEVIACEIFRTPYTGYCRMYSEYSDYSVLQYATYFDGTGYLIQLVDYNNASYDEATIALADEIVLSVVYGSAAPAVETASQEETAQEETAQSSVPTVSVVSTPMSMENIYMSDIGMTVSVPAAWYTGMASEGVSSELATVFGLTEDDLPGLFESAGAYVSLNAITDDNGSAMFQVVYTAGAEDFDMRSDDLDEDALMEGFLSTYDAGSIVDAGLYTTPAASYIKVYTILSSGASSYPLMQYSTNIDGRLIIIQYVDYSVSEFDYETIALLDSIAYNAFFD